MSIWRHLVVIALAAAAGLHASRWWVAGFVPDLLLVVGLYPTMRRGLEEGFALAWLAGLAVDLLSAGSGVPMSLAFMLLAVVVDRARRAFDLDRDRLAQALALGVAALIAGNVQAIALRLGGAPHATGLLIVSFGTALATAAVAPPVYAILDRLPLAGALEREERMPLAAVSGGRGAR